MPDPNLPTCEYECISGTYTLVGGSAPEGYTCPLILGFCDDDGDRVKAPPVPIIIDDTAAIAALTASQSSVPANSAIYVFDPKSVQLHFSSGNAEPGFGFKPTISMEDLATNYPDLVSQVSALSQFSSLVSVKLILPALPASALGIPRE